MLYCQLLQFYRDRMHFIDDSHWTELLREPGLDLLRVSCLKHCRHIGRRRMRSKKSANEVGTS